MPLSSNHYVMGCDEVGDERCGNRTVHLDSMPRGGQAGAGRAPARSVRIDALEVARRMEVRPAIRYQ